MDLTALHAEFDRSAVSWRAQTLTRDGGKALALAYIDARDVMDRLDAICGPEGWQDSYEETPKGRVLCTISIMVNGTWVSKSDGAGNTDVEGEKGAISDAFKRAAVKWGVGRYLYDIEAPWVPCETYEHNGKKRWKSWTADPWSCVRGQHKPQAKPAKKENDDDSAQDPTLIRDRIKTAIEGQTDISRLEKLWQQGTTASAVKTLPEPMQKELQAAFTHKAADLFQAPQNDAQYQ